jgi:hypothetical protein
MPKLVNTAELSERLRAAAQEVRDRTTALRLAHAARNQLVTEAIDVHGMSHREVGRLAGLSSPARVSAILAGSQDDDDA